LLIPEARGDSLEVLVGGLGLGFTAKAALDRKRVRSVTVVELLPEVIRWHESGLVPLGATLSGDPRCRFVRGDFFRYLEEPGDRYHAILVDIDHAPDSWLHPAHGEFYDEAGIGRAAARLADGGAFGFWSSGRPDVEFEAGSHVGSCGAHAADEDVAGGQFELDDVFAGGSVFAEEQLVELIGPGLLPAALQFGFDCARVVAFC